MKTQVKMLKVKIKSLAEESRIIRLEERRAGGDVDLRGRLYAHRVCDVRQEQRLSLLAYAFLRGRPLAAVEAKPATPPDWERVRKLVEKFGVVSWLSSERTAQAAAFKEWSAQQAVAQPG